MFFSFHIVGQKAALQVIFLRAILFLAALGSIFFDAYRSRFIVLFGVLILLLISVFIKVLIARLGARLYLFFIFISLFLFALNQSIIFSILLLIFYFLSTFFYRKTALDLDENALSIPGPFGSRRVIWRDLENVVFKDGLITVDFKSNRVLQLSAEPVDCDFDSALFNEFCQKRLKLTADN